MKLELIYSQDYNDIFGSKFFIIKKMFEDKKILEHVAYQKNKKLLYLYFHFLNLLFMNNEIKYDIYLNKFNELLNVYPDIKKVVQNEVNKSRKRRNYRVI